MKSSLHVLVLTVMLASTLTAQQNPAPSTKKLYIEEYIETTTWTSLVSKDEIGSFTNHETTSTRNISLLVKKDVMKQCPSLVTVTDNRDAANYVLHIVTDASTLSRPDGTVAYTSKAKWKNSKLAKDVCTFIGSQK
jgi:hypothetical protein